MVPAVQQWLSPVGNISNLVVSTRLDVSAVLIWYWSPGGFLGNCWSPVCTGHLRKVLKPVKESLSNRIDELASESEGKQAKSKFPSSMYFYVGHKVWLRFRVGSHLK